MMSIWVAVKAPLLIGTDVTLLRDPADETIAILANPEVHQLESNRRPALCSS